MFRLYALCSVPYALCLLIIESRVRLPSSKTCHGPKRHTGRDPWFDRLTTLSEIEGVSSKLVFSLDSG